MDEPLHILDVPALAVRFNPGLTVTIIVLEVVQPFVAVPVTV